MVNVNAEVIAPNWKKQTKKRLDGVLGTQTSRLLLSYYNNTAIEATALFVQQQVDLKGAIIADLYHVTPPHGENGCYTG